MSLDQLKSDYKDLTQQLGEKAYVERILKEEINILVKKINEVNVKANELQKPQEVKPELVEVK